jgi:hypothetical protein
MDGHRLTDTLIPLLKRLLAAGVFALIAAVTPVSAADVSVGTMELYSHGYMQSGLFNLDNYAKFDLSFQGGLKFAAKLSFGLETSNFNLNAVPGSTAPVADVLARTLLFNGAEVTAKRPLGLPLNIAYFLGKEDIFASGDVFADVFGSSPVNPEFGGYTAYPSPAAILYDGVYRVSGNGLKFSFPASSKTFVLDTYIYQDGYLGSGIYSADARAALNLDALKLEIFAGGTVPEGSYGLYRAGLFFYTRPGPIGEFVTAIGLPHYLPFSAITVNDFYLLLEPRVHFDPLSIILTLFWHPNYYLETPTNEGGSFDVAVKLQLGSMEKNGFYGGLENLASVRQIGSNQFTYSLSPYFRFNTSGVIWDLKVTAQILPFALDTLFQGYLGVRTEF